MADTIDPSIALGFKPPHFMGAQDLMGIQDQIYRNKLMDAQLQEGQQQTKQRNALTSMLQQPGAMGPDGLPNPQIMAQLMALDPGLAKTYESIAADRLATQRQALDMNRIEHDIKEKQRIATKDLMLPYIREVQDVYKDELKKNPQTAQQKANTWWQNQIDTLEKRAELTNEDAARLRSQAFDPRLFAYMTAQEIPTKPVAGWDMLQDPKTGQVYRTGPAGEIQIKKADGWSDVPGLPAGILKLGSGRQPEAMVEELTPGGIEQAGWSYLLLGKNFPGLGKASAQQKVKIINEASRIGTKLGLTPAEMAMLPFTNKVKTKAMSNLTYWGASVKAGTERLHRSLDMAIEFAKQLTPSEIRKINQLVIAGKTQFGSGIASKYGMAINTVSREYGRLISGPTSNAMLPVEAMKNTDALLNTGNTIDQLEGMREVMLREAAITEQSVADQLTALSSSMVQPELGAGMGQITFGGQGGQAPPQQQGPGGIGPTATPPKGVGGANDYSHLWK